MVANPQAIEEKYRIFVECHLFYNLGISNPNRDETGQPKTAIYGGDIRVRISAQSKRRATRELLQKEYKNFIFGERTRMIPDIIRADVIELGMSEHDADLIVPVFVENYIGTLEPLPDGQTQYTRTKETHFFGSDERSAFARLLVKSKEVLLTARAEDDERIAAEKTKTENSKKKKTSEDKKIKPSKIFTSLAKAVKKIQKDFDVKTSAIDVALTGRMVTGCPRAGVDGALYSAHLIGVDAHSFQTDYVSALDDVTRENASGAAMITSAEFGSPCVYGYDAIDVGQLIKNLHGDVDLAMDALKAFLTVHPVSELSGKSRTSATNKFPVMTVFALRTEGTPLSLGNAFRSAIKKTNDVSLTEKAVECLDREWSELRRRNDDVDAFQAVAVECYGQEAEHLTTLKPFIVNKLPDAVDKIVTATKAAL